DPRGDLYAADCHSRAAMMLLRGGQYPHFGRPPEGLGFAPEIMTHDHGSTAICGIVYYAADQFPAAYHDHLFIGNVMTNRTNRDTLERHGSSWTAVKQPDFLISEDRWFRPVDIKLGPDGALYVADFYNRIIGHYEVPLDHPGRDRERGRIWRIVYRGEGSKGTPAPRADWTKTPAEELVQDLAHPNLAVRGTATNQPAAPGPDGAAAVAQVLKSKDQPARPYQWAHGIWALERLGALDAPTLAAAARHSDRVVRVHAQRILAERVLLPEAAR